MDDIKALSSLVVAVGFLIGLILFIYGVYGFKKNADSPQQFPISMCIGNCVTGMFLLASSFMYSAFRGTFIGDNWQGDRAGLSLDRHMSGSSGNNMPDNFLTRALTPEARNVIIAFVFLVGLIAFIRGLFLFRDFGERSKSGGSSTAMAFFHVIGGIICMNILMFSCIFAKTFNIPHICSV